MRKVFNIIVLVLLVALPMNIFAKSTKNVVNNKAMVGKKITLNGLTYRSDNGVYLYMIDKATGVKVTLQGGGPVYRSLRVTKKVYSITLKVTKINPKARVITGKFISFGKKGYKAKQILNNLSLINKKVLIKNLTYRSDNGDYLYMISASGVKLTIQGGGPAFRTSGKKGTTYNVRVQILKINKNKRVITAKFISFGGSAKNNAVVKQNINNQKNNNGQKNKINNSGQFFANQILNNLSYKGRTVTIDSLSYRSDNGAFLYMIDKKSGIKVTIQNGANAYRKLGSKKSMYKVKVIIIKINVKARVITAKFVSFENDIYKTDAVINDSSLIGKKITIGGLSYRSDNGGYLYLIDKNSGIKITGINGAALFKSVGAGLKNYNVTLLITKINRAKRVITGKVVAIK